jgi:pyruvate/2-oxoglutarate dehydrogenase complex dihydrolipoamide acyltransferase (E2) component
MNTEHTIAAPADGVLISLAVVVGQLIEVGAVLAVLATGGTSNGIRAAVGMKETA